MQHFVQLPKTFLVGIIIVEAFSPLNSFTKPTYNIYVVQTWTKALSTSLSLQGCLKIELSLSSMM
jgi:hypothetical protein